MIEIEKLNFEKFAGLIPAIIINEETNQVLMLGFMNREALQKTIETNLVTFFSRTRNCLWTKGETSGNYLSLVEITQDCDNDTLLISAKPSGPVCHTGADTCFDRKENNLFFLNKLESIIAKRKAQMPQNSYTTKLFKEGSNRIIQKVGEEAIETVIAAKNNDRLELINESSDLIFHLMVLLAEKNISLDEIALNLKNRHEKSR